MYTMIRRYTVTPPGGLRELGAKVRDTLVPTLRGLPGFVSYQFVGGHEDGRDVVASVSTFATEAGALESARRAAEWVAANTGGYQLTEPQITVGEVIVNTATGVGASSYAP